VVAIWAVTGPIFGFSDTWQLVINTGTTIVTFLMVFLIQHTQNRDSMAMQLKLAELIVAVKGAQNRLAAVEECSEAELNELQEGYRRKSQIPDRVQTKIGRQPSKTSLRSRLRTPPTLHALARTWRRRGRESPPASRRTAWLPCPG
jgi:low affinity Fe/Cu permease